MKKCTKKVLSLLLAVCMLAAPITEIPAKAADTPTSSYNWQNHNRNIEYPGGSSTTAKADSAQDGYGAERMVDGNSSTHWEASWSNAPARINIELSTGNAEYITGIRYTSRQDNNNGGIMTDYEIYASEDGVTYGSTYVTKGTLTPKLGTFYITFDQPVKAKSIKINTNARAIAEMRLLYIPTGESAYSTLLSEAEALSAYVKTGTEAGSYPEDAVSAFREGITQVKAAAPSTANAYEEACKSLFDLTSMLRRSYQVSASELQQEIEEARSALDEASVGTTPMTWDQADIDAFRAVVEKAEEAISGSVVSEGAVWDAQELLENGSFAFKLAQNKPVITYTGTAEGNPETAFDQLLESHFVGYGAGENIYLELDYQKEYMFDSLTFYTWWAGDHGINKIKVQVKDKNGVWQDVDDGKNYTMNWTTHSNVSESHTVTFETSARGTAIRIYILEVRSSTQKIVIDELIVGMRIPEHQHDFSAGTTCECGFVQNIGKAEGLTLTLDGKIRANFWMSLANASDATKVMFYIPGEADPLEVPYDANKVLDDKFGFTAPVAARRMAEPITAIMTVDGVDGSVTVSESIMSYSQKLFEIPEYESYYSLVRAMLNYGAYAQSYFNAREGKENPDENLANQYLTDEQKNVETVTAADLADAAEDKSVTGTVEGLTYKTTSLVLEDTTSIRHYFSAQECTDLETFKAYGFICKDGNGNDVELKYGAKGNFFYVEIPNIAANQMNDRYTLSINGGEQVITCSVYVYLHYIISTYPSDDKLVKVAKAMYLYGQEANSH